MNTAHAWNVCAIMHVSGRSARNVNRSSWTSRIARLRPSTHEPPAAVFDHSGWRCRWHLGHCLECRGSLRLLPPWLARASTAVRMPAGTAALAEAAEQDAAQGQQAERFPERDAAQPEDVGQQPVRQPLHEDAADENERHEPEEKCNAD